MNKTVRAHVKEENYNSVSQTAETEIDRKRISIIDKRYNVPLSDHPLIYMHSADNRFLHLHRATNNDCNNITTFIFTNVNNS